MRKMKIMTTGEVIRGLHITPGRFYWAVFNGRLPWLRKVRSGKYFFTEREVERLRKHFLGKTV